MKRIFLIIGATLLAYSSAMAQDDKPQDAKPQQEQRQAPKRLTPQERATMQADRLKEELELTEDQYKKVYKAILNREKETENLMPVGRPGGMRPGGMRPGGGGGMRGGGGPGVAKVNTGMNSYQEKIKSFRERCDKKIKKALTEEQYAKYEEYEAKRLREQQERMQRMKNNRQGGQRPGGQRPQGPPPQEF